MGDIRRLAYAILDGALIAIDRPSGTADRCYFFGKRCGYGVDARAIGDPHGRLMWVSPALPGSVHDLRGRLVYVVYE